MAANQLTLIHNANVQVVEKDLYKYVIAFIWVLVCPAVIFFAKIDSGTAWLGYGIYWAALIIMYKIHETRPSAVVIWIFNVVCLLSPGFVWTMATQPEQLFPM